MTPPSDSADLGHAFEFAPVSLWLEDFSGLKRLLDRLRAEGVRDLGAYLDAHPEAVQAGMAALQVLRVNQRTLQLFAAPDQATLLSRLGEVFSGDMAASVKSEWTQLWRGGGGFVNQTVNYALDGRRLDVEVRGRVLPGHEDDWSRVMVSLDDITQRVKAERHARDLFDLSPVSLWVEDFSAVKRLLDGVRAQGIGDFSTFLKVHPEFITRCMQEIRVIDVNRQTLRMFGAASKDVLLQNIGRVFRGEMHDSFAEQLQDLWTGKRFQQREVVNYALSGETVHIHMQFAVLDEHMDAWDLVLVSLVDITARKKAEAYLEYLGQHDVLTQLRNRSFYSEELNRLARKGPWPLSVLVLDMNGLKEANDAHGHAAGDGLLRRVGEVLTKAVDPPIHPARIGGDEFAILLPGTDLHGAEAVRQRVVSILELNNQFHAGQSGQVLSLAMGVASCTGGDQIEAMLAAADRAMYQDKERFYRESESDRRRG